MKKLFVVIMMFVTFLLVGCDNKNEEVDLSNNKTVKKELSKYSESDSYGEIVHRGELANKVVVKNLRMGDNVYALGVGLVGNKKSEVVSLICDVRSNEVGLTYNIKNDEGYIPRGHLELSIMQYRPGVTDIREADESQDPVFSTANGDTEFLKGLAKAAALPKDTVLALVIDKSDDQGNYNGIAWSPLFTAGQLLAALPDSVSKCSGMQLNLDDVHLVVAERPQ